MPKKMRALFNEIYKQFNASMSPILIIILFVEDNNYDINISPDKREVCLKNEKEMLEVLRANLESFFEDV